MLVCIISIFSDTLIFNFFCVIVFSFQLEKEAEEAQKLSPEELEKLERVRELGLWT